MNGHQLDLTVENYGGSTLVTLQGIFFEQEIDRVQSEITALIQDGNKNLIVDLNHVEFRSKKILNLWIQIMNDVKGRQGYLILIVKKHGASAFFRGYENIFDIFPNLGEFNRSGFVKNLRKTGIMYSKRTGIRLTPGIALVLTLLIGGWLLTLLSIIRQQEKDILEQVEKVKALEQQKSSLVQNVASLKVKLEPLKDLGLIKDSIKTTDYDFVSDWVQYLELLEKRNLKKRALAGQGRDSNDSQVP